MNRGTYRLLALGILPIVALLVIIGAAGAAPKGGVTVDLKVAQSEFRASQDVLVTVTLSNPTKQPAHILKWLTPADGVDASLFTVTRDGSRSPTPEPRSSGPPPPTATTSCSSPARASSNVVDLGDVYDFTGTGRYEISYNVSSYDLFDKKGTPAKAKDALASDTISVKAAGRAGKGKPTPPPPPGPGQNAFNACTTAQQSALSAARTQAKAYAANAASYLGANNQGPRYTTWFGVFASTRYNTVTSHFNAISSAMQNAGIVFDCSSKQERLRVRLSRISRTRSTSAASTGRRRRPAPIPRPAR